MLAFMTGGGLVALAGLWLMLREGVSGAAAKLALGSFEVQSTSAGFAVFLAGTAAFTAPLVAPESTKALVERVMPAGAGPADFGLTVERTALGSVTGLIPADKEPDNNAVEGAAVVRPGDLAGGTHSGDDPDWFLFDTRSLENQRVEVEIEERGEGCHAHFYDGQQQYMGLVSLVPGRNLFRLDVNNNEAFFAQLTCLETVGTQAYHVSFGAVAN
ncbi:MAG: hypothetical protein KDK03_09700 [Rhodobacteraceae bacterium]|nr:hypothetical protein [Paracoccaceae bacterium]